MSRTFKSGYNTVLGPPQDKESSAENPIRTDIRKLFTTCTSQSTIPWTADLEYWISGRELDGTVDPAWRTEQGYLELCDSLGIFPYYWYKDFWCAKPVYDDSVVVGEQLSTRYKITEWKTPVGSMSRIEKFLPESASWAYAKHPVASVEDLAILEYLVAHRHLEPSSLENYAERLQTWQSHGGIPSIALPRSPLAALFYEWAGVVNAVYLIMDEPARLRRLFDQMQTQESPILEALSSKHFPLVHFADNISSDNMAGYFGSWMKDGYLHRINTLHRAGIASVVHLDGVVAPIIRDIAATGIDAIEALTPLPGGDISVHDMRKLAGNADVVLWGGIPGIMFSPPYTEQELIDHVRTVLDCWQGTPCILGVADQVPVDGIIGRVRAISDLVASYSK